MSQASEMAVEASVARSGIVRLSYTHDAMVDVILQEPTVTYEELAEIFGYSRGWVQRVCVSDSFQARIAQRKEQLLDPIISRSLNERMRGVAVKAIDLISEKLASPEAGAQYALDALGIASGAMNRKG